MFLYSAVFFLFFAICKKMYAEWGSIDWEKLDIKGLWLILASLSIMANSLLQVLIWKKVLAIFHYEIPYSICFRIEMISQIGKYLPGKVGLVFTKLIECNKVGIPNKVSIIAASYHVGMGLYFQCLIGMITLPVILNATEYINIGFSITDYTILLFIGFILIYPQFFVCFINFFFAAIKKEPVEIYLKFYDWIYICSIFILQAFISGCIGLFLLNTFYFIPFEKIPYIMGARSWAFLIGLLNLFAPSGIGVRDGILVELYSYLIPIPIAFAVAIASRLAGTIVEWCLIGIALFFRSKEYRKEE